MKQSKGGEKAEKEAEPISVSTAWLYMEEPYEEQEVELEQALEEVQALYRWATDEMGRRWNVLQGTAKVTDLIVDAARWIRGQRKPLQHYTMVSILNEAVASFNRSIAVDHTGIGGQMLLVALPKDLPDNHREYEIVLQSRAVWTRYLATYNRISTIYGNLYLQNGWEWELEQMAEKLEIQQRIIPYLIYSAAIKRMDAGWMLRFNIHHPNSGFGRPRRVAARKKLKEL